MKQYKVLVVMLVAIICLGLVSIPNAFSQVSQVDTNVKVLSYSWYVNPSGDLIVVGEVQNTGNSILSSVSLNAAVYASDGTELASASTMPYVSYLLQQKIAPFYIDLGNPGTSLTASSVSYVDFTVSNAPTTSEQEYKGLYLDTGFSNSTSESAYVVTGLVFNNGNQTANDIRVVGTYYNSAGTVVAVGFNNVTSSLSPNNGTIFTVSEFDATSSLVSQISNYSLLVQTSTLQNNALSGSSGSSSSSSGSSGSSSSSSGSSGLIYAIVGTVVIVVVAVTALIFLRKRRNLPPPPLPPPPPS